MPPEIEKTMMRSLFISVLFALFLWVIFWSTRHVYIEREGSQESQAHAINTGILYMLLSISDSYCC